MVETAERDRADAEQALEVAKETLSNLESTLQDRQQVGSHALVLSARAHLHLAASACSADARTAVCIAQAPPPRAGTPSA